MITNLITKADTYPKGARVRGTTPLWMYNQFVLAAINVNLVVGVHPVGSRHTSIAVIHNLVNATKFSILDIAYGGVIANCGIYIKSGSNTYTLVEDFAHELHYYYPPYNGEIINASFSIQYWVDFGVAVIFPQIIITTSNRNIPNPLDATGNNTINIQSSRTGDGYFAIPFNIPIIFTYANI